MMGGHILIVEDDEHIAKAVQYNLQKNGFRCTITMTGEAVFFILEKEHVDLILLDIMLPGIDGFEVCRMLKQDRILARIPIIIMTAKDTETDRVVGFQLGALDYVVKPFSIRELSLRIKAILDRSQEKKKTATFWWPANLLLT